MTIQDNGNNKSFASAPSTEEESYDPEAFIVNAADDVFALSVSTTAAANSGYGQLNKSAISATTNAAAHTTPIAYSTGKPPQPPSPQPRPSSSSVAVATGAPMPTPTSATTKTTSTTTTTNTRGNNSQCCCTGLTCCGITSIVLVSIFFIILICILAPVLFILFLGNVLDGN
ncbi:hypothetical protein FRACYDRAFT_267501 [Fragilariopsis cylindrus CCMP1102]|uniref:Uncharacterized protein n=1 Tax=Fragilariopsis cylindrus CCMP1102 TaxID=635003 RepID=A0A1E7FYT7_9STRA|nr:hypothetical protein FRACYDRAFT_267501 [Fragilariopsis cylindrus CCMP1102]|eukprot:OEU23322.1 hypothetical protein FRACYDRAFT_267501 [Fragilariopsis cylindrus CCMP1102]